MEDLSQFLLKGMTMDLTTVLYSVNLLYLIALHIDPLKYDKDFISSVRSSYSHPYQLLIHHPTFSDHTGPQHWTFTF